MLSSEKNDRSVLVTFNGVLDSCVTAYARFSGVGVSRCRRAADGVEGEQPYETGVVRRLSGVAHAQCR